MWKGKKYKHLEKIGWYEGDEYLNEDGTLNEKYDELSKSWENNPREIQAKMAAAQRKSIVLKALS